MTVVVLTLGKLAVTLRIPVQDGWRQRDTLQVFGDDALGVIDTDRPLVSKPLSMFPDDVRVAVAPPGWAKTPWGSTPWCSGAPRLRRLAGWCQRKWCSVPWCGGAAIIEVTVRVRQEFRVRRFAVRAIDGAGNPQGALVEFEHLVSGEEPLPLSRFTYAGYDAANDVVSFSFEE